MWKIQKHLPTILIWFISFSSLYLWWLNTLWTSFWYQYWKICWYVICKYVKKARIYNFGLICVNHDFQKCIPIKMNNRLWWIWTRDLRASIPILYPLGWDDWQTNRSIHIIARKNIWINILWHRVINSLRLGVMNHLSNKQNNWNCLNFLSLYIENLIVDKRVSQSSAVFKFQVLYISTKGAIHSPQNVGCIQSINKHDLVLNCMQFNVGWMPLIDQIVKNYMLTTSLHPDTCTCSFVIIQHIYWQWQSKV